MLVDGKIEAGGRVENLPGRSERDKGVADHPLDGLKFSSQHSGCKLNSGHKPLRSDGK